MKRKLPPIPTDAARAVAQMRLGARTIARTALAFVSESERLAYFKAGKLASTTAQRRKTAMLRGRLRKHIERWQARMELLAGTIPDLRERVRELATCIQNIFGLCEQIPLKDRWPGDALCVRLNEIARELGAKYE